MMGRKMEQPVRENYPLISVVIASFNYGRYLSKAIESVIAQSYPHLEIIVVDDGSTDDTAEVVRRYPSVRYLFQANRGVSASRNAGISLATGAFVCFLDADDWLEPQGLELNYRIIEEYPAAAFVSGSYILLNADNGKTQETVTEFTGGHYLHLLKSNYIGMLAAVLFRRQVLNEIKFDESIRACEDYDLFLRIARRYPVGHHPGCIATYFHHNFSLSHDYPLMIASLQTVIRKQENHLNGPAERAAFQEGLQQWTEYEGLIHH